MKTISIDENKYKGISAQQLLLLSVLKNFTNNSDEVKTLGLNFNSDVDFDSLYKLVKSHCSNELEILKKLNSEAQGF